MRNVIAHLQSVPGMIGALVSDRSGAPLAVAFPPLFEEGLIGQASSTLAAAVTSLHDETSFDMIDLRFLSGRIIVKPFADAFLIVLCTRDANMQMLAMSLNMAVKKLAAMPMQTAPAAVVANAAEIHDAMKKLLMRRVGPISDILFRNHVKGKGVGYYSTRKGLRELADALGDEIENPAERATFSQEVRLLIS